MRLIDANTLQTDYIVPSTSTGTVNREFVSMEQILNAPTIEERKRGKWILTPYTDCGSPIHECSECSHGISGDVQVRNFCPNCGADMRG